MSNTGDQYLPVIAPAPADARLALAVCGFDRDEEAEAVTVRTVCQTDYEDTLKKNTRTSGCAIGTVFGDMMQGLEGLKLPRSEVRTSWLYAVDKIAGWRVLENARAADTTTVKSEPKRSVRQTR